MKRAILHIGTEKTGTTSIQNFLYANRIKLGAKGILFSETAGYLSNQNLVVYAKKAPEPDLAPQELDVSNASDLALWKDQFAVKHSAEVVAFQQRHADSTVVYSAEHLQSRLTTVSEIKRAARLLRPMFDEIEVLVYLRRQDKYALSAHSTAVRAGGQNDFAFETVNAEGPYYNYRELLQNWSDVFGEDAIRVRLFEKSRLVDHDVVADFKNVTGIDNLNIELDSPKAVNEALSRTALSLLRRFNELQAGDACLQGKSKQQIRGRLLEAVQGIEDDFGKVLPVRSSAVAFYERFVADNQWIADRWLEGRGFDENFSEYPLEEIELPAIENLDSQLEELIAGLFQSKQTIAKLKAVKSQKNSEPPPPATPPAGYARRLVHAIKHQYSKVS